MLGKLSMTLLFVMNSVIGYSQLTDTLLRDTVKLISLYYWDDDRKETASVYSYVAHDGHLYNATRYLNSRNSGCIPTPYSYIDNDCTFELIQKYEKKNPEAFKKIPARGPFAFKCVNLDVLFITEFCELQKKEYNPLLELMGDEKFVIIHFVSVISNTLTNDLLPPEILAFIKR